MADNNNIDNRNNTYNNISPDSQDRLCEMLSPTQVNIEEGHNDIVMKKESKCHGNRKLQHFKRKCRARDLTEEQIIALIRTRNDEISEQLRMRYSKN
ncbi:unnamed protein product [Rotaria sp. Silwood1]|nr:unnamed protein product [Rotaria sp. Silwood1]CAF1636004.1 unnamed protein product [Rotaria sp. Silwood1]